MKFTTALSSLTLIASTVAAHGLSHEHLHTKRQQSGTVVTTGAKGFGDGKVHSRLEISDLAANRPDQWTLFVAALRRWQDTAATNVTGYYEIAGIHGVPRADWDGVGQCSSCGDADGYATHDIFLFPTWHRSFVALFEQEFLNMACQVAGEYTGTKQQTMLEACQTMRWPYWDWAAKPEASDVFPAFLSSPQIVVDLPTGQQTVDNPLYSYTIPDPSAMYYSPFTSWKNTLRYPNGNDAGATSQEQSAVNAFNNIQANMQDQVYSLFGCDDYLHFSNDAAGSTDKCPTSIEQIHNTIHTTGGGPGSNSASGGHLTYLPLASFDVVFWLHHSNVDRLLALWQAINPNSFGATQNAAHNTWTIASGTSQNANSPLAPFRKDSSNFYTSNDVRNYTQAFAYTYPEFTTSDGSRASIVNFVNSLYGPSANLTAAAVSKNAETDSAGNSGRALQGGSSSSSSSSAAGSSTSSSVSASSSSAVSTTSSQAPFSLSNATSTASGGFAKPTGGFLNTTVPDNSTFNAPNGSSYQYTCHLTTPRYALNGSYSIYLFDAPAKSNDSTTWLGDEGCIGTIGVFAGGEMGPAAQKINIAGAIPVTRHLQKRCEEGKLSSMSEKNAVPYLTKNLHWRIVNLGQEVSPEQLPSFKATVFSGTASPPSEGSLGTWNNHVPQIEVTKNKAGGAKVAPSYSSGSNSGSGTGSGSPSSSSCSEESSPATSSPASPSGYAPAQSSPASPVETSPSSPAGYSPPAGESPASPVQSGPAAAPYPASNGTVPGYQPTASGTGAYSYPLSTSPAAYTGAASKASFGFAGIGLAVVAGLAAAL